MSTNACFEFLKEHYLWKIFRRATDLVKVFSRIFSLYFLYFSQPLLGFKLEQVLVGISKYVQIN